MREARIDETTEGRLPAGEGWFILNLGEMPWETVPGFGVWRDLDWARVSGDEPVVGIHIHVLQPGETNGYYHAEAAQEGFVVLSGECLALVEGQELAEHENPGEATVHVLHGRVRLIAGADSWEARRGDLLVVPQAPHRLAALADSVVLLTVAKLDHRRR